ncbi:MAG: excisionase [Deltaproteobacteria bacterium]|jgi:hypothetical protein|nr:excisionase [Deltaproteobacteria bacterium]
MDYELMHKDIPVAVLKLSTRYNITLIDKIMDVAAPEHLPIGTTQSSSLKCNPSKLEGWLNERSIPKERSGLTKFIENVGLPYPNQLLLDSLGLSLSDQYWMRPAGSGIAWRDVNFFQNGFSGDLGDILLGIVKRVNGARSKPFFSPDSSSSGMLPKRWIICEGRRVLMKGGKLPYFQEPQNEAIASKVMESLGIQHVHYEFTVIGGKRYSLCETFVDTDTDFVSAFYIADRLYGMPLNASRKYDFFIGRCEKLGITGAREALDRIFIIDFILFNTDRHFNNFGAVRNADTLEWKGFSPVFDTGNCLWNERGTDNIFVREIGECKPFRKDFRKQLLHVNDFSWIDIDKLKIIPDQIASMFIPTELITPSRIDKIRQALAWRVQFLENAILHPELLREKSRSGRRSGPRVR